MSLPRFLCVSLLSAVMACLSVVRAAPGDVDATFNPNANDTIYSMAAQPDGKVIVGGEFTTLGGVTRNHIARYNANGTLDTGFNPNVGGIVYSTVVLADGRLLLAGNFTTVGGSARNHIARINADGVLDATFNANVDGVSPAIYSALVQPDGKIVIGGSFTTVGGVTRNNIARLNGDGTLDVGFNPNVSSTVRCMARQSDGKIVIGGSFSQVSAVSRNNLARVDAGGSLETSFNPNVGYYVYSMLIQPDGRIVIGGSFNTLAGVTRNYIARLNAEGTLDSGYNPNASSTVFSMALQVDGKLLIGGNFNTVGAITRNCIARLNSDGATDTGFNPNSSDSVHSAMLQADGKILIGGNFTTVGTTTRNRLARLDNDFATQSLSVQDLNLPGVTRLEWLRGGAAPDGQEVTFELSTNGGTAWSPLGPGVRTPTGWELTGQALPSGGQVRARTRPLGGYGSNSSGLVESIIPFGLQPEIAVEQPALTNITDGGIQGFGNVQTGTSGNLTFTIRNTGTANLTGLGVTIDGTNAADFSVTSSPAVSIAPGGTATFTVSFAPGATGARSAALHITSNDFDEAPFDISLTGTGTAPDISAFQPSTTAVADGGTKGFGNVLIGANASLVFTLKNTGTADLTGLGITIDGANAADFTVTENPVSPVSGPTGSTTFTVRFAPTSTGAKAAALHIASNVTGTKNPYDITLTGTGVTPEIALEQPVSVDIPDGGSRSFATTLTGDNVTISFIIRNSGTTNLTGLGITIDGPNASEFTVTTNPTAPVAASATTTFVVRFAPTTAGSKTAALHIASNDLDENPFDINLSGTAITSAAEIVVEQPALTEIQDGEGRGFSSIPFGGNSSLTFAIRNTGNINLTGLAGITIDGTNAADFTIITAPSNIVAPGAGTSLVVRFAPGGTGLRIAALHIANNDTNENPFDILLTGTGTGPGNGDVNYNPDVDGHVFSTSVQPDGKAIVGGAFETIGGVPRNYLARLNADGTLDSAFNPDVDDWVYCTAVQADGKILVAGSFTSIGGTPRTRIARLNADGSLDTGFAPTVNGQIYCMLVRPDGKILIGGSIDMVAEDSYGNLVGLTTSGILDSGFGQYFNGDVYSVALQEDGKILVAGDFTEVDGIPCNYLARLKASSQQDVAFDPNPNGPVFNVALQPDGKILVGGDFTTIGGTVRNHLARLNSEGSLEAFNPGVNDDVESIALQANGKILIGGSFTNVAGTTRNYLARIHGDGSLDTAFHPNANAPVYSAILQADGKILIGGDFTSVGNLGRNRIMRLDNDAASQALTLPNTSRVQWLRGGASPEAAWVSFDLSTNGGASWAPLGVGSRSRIAQRWELSGLNLPANGQVRARAYIPGGYSNASGGLLEVTTMVTGPPAPEISIEQPALNLVTDGGSKDFGNAVVAGEKSLVFTMRNSGNADLTGLGITFTGLNAADFSVSMTPVSPVVGAGSTTFTVKFAPSTAGIKTATLQLASNDADENPYDITLTGRALVSSGDEDGDGIANGTEVALAALGFDPFTDSSALRALVQANASGLGITGGGGLNEEMLALGNPVLEKNPTTGKFVLRLSLQKSTNLSSWSPVLGFAPTFDPINGTIDLEITPSGSNAEFLRVFGAKP